MKKLFVGFLSLFLLFGASFLTACGSKGTTLTLSKQQVEIQIHAGDDEGYEIVTAEVRGTDKASISASATSSYESIVKVTTSKISETKVSIKIEGLTEGDAEITVKSGNQTKYIYATVYSEVSQMSQKTEEGIKSNYLVRGQDNILEENNLIEFYPSSKSRHTITWSLVQPQAGLSLIENSLSIGNEFIGDNVSLLATTEKDVQTTITLPVLDKIESEINMGFSYSKSTAFQQISQETNTFNIVPNVSTDEKYQGYVLIDYVGDLDISGYALDSNGQPTDDIVVNRDGSISDRPVFVIYANKEKTNINQDYTIYFKIGYKDYDYALSTLESLPITIQARELVSGVILSTYGSGNIENSTQTLYTEYADSDYSSVYGQEFGISMIPSTVIGATNKYSISLSRVELGEPITKNEDDCPIEIWYRDKLNGNVWTFLPLTYDENTGNFVTNPQNLPNASSLFIKGSSENLIVQSAEGLKITFTSQDNKNISSSFNLKLVRSVSKGDFKFPDGDFKVDSSIENNTLERTFTLKGQTSIEGLDIITTSKAVTFDEIHYISNDEESVTFKVVLTLKKASYGVTTLDTYNIIHKNGLVSDDMKIDIFLPLKDTSMYVDNVNNVSNSLVDSAFNNKTYSVNGTLVDNSTESLSTLMLKNKSTTPVKYIYNQINGISAVANISVDYFDFNPEATDLDSFIEMAESEDGVANIIALAKDNKESSVAIFNGDFSSILTHGVGHTYAVVYFTGKGTENVDENGNITFVRIIRIESLVTPEGMSITPDADKQVSLYSIESLATSDEDLTQHDISIKFVKTNVTYKNIQNLTFISRNQEVMGAMSRSQDGKNLSWEFGRYTVSNINLTDEGITFTIAALHTYGEYLFADTLDIHYVIYNQEDEKVYDISSSIKITINNAQRIEELIWENSDEDGLYFEVGNKSFQYMVFKTTPTNSKNKSIAYVLTDEDGVAQTNENGNQTFVNVADTVSSNILSVNLNFNAGKTGYIYILPADAIYNNQIKYYYKDGDNEREGYLNPSNLGVVIDNEGTTNYDYLIANAYFKSAVTGGEVKNVEFKDILLKIKIIVADGKSFEHSYRIFDEDTFNSIGKNAQSSYTADKYYTIMTSLDLASERTAITNFTGGLQGYNNEVTIKLNGNNFATTLGKDAQIRNISFIGNVNAQGFLANENKGTITNVTIDVNGIEASTLSFEGEAFVGGLVGINSGTIDGGKVLGLSITGQSIVGGIAGRNTGAIKNSIVEFYNLYAGLDGENKVYQSNTFTGENVGAIVGEIGANSSISYSYAYDYNLTNTSKVLNGSATNGAFAGKHNLSAGQKASIDYSFSVIGQSNPYNGYSTDLSPVTMTNYYYGYYDGETYKVNPESITSNPNFVQPNDEGFDSTINNNYPYLKNLKQSEKITSVAYDITTNEENGYYKSVAVDSTNAILFFYSLRDNFLDLTNAEKNDLNDLNTISLSELLGEYVSENVIVSSSDMSKVKVVGSSIIVRKTGDVQLTLSSKQNVQLNKTINVKIISPLSKVQIAWIDLAENVNYVEDNSNLSIQKTRSRDFSISFYRANVYLGTLATSYQLVENDYALNITSTTDEAGEAVESQVVSNKIFKLIAGDNSVKTKFVITPVVFTSESEEDYQTAINNVFKRNFVVNPTEGVINFAISGQTIMISPSLNASVKAEIQTTAEDDFVVPEIMLDGVKLERSGSNGVYKYKVLGEKQAIIEAVVTNITDSATKEANKTNKVKKYLFDVNFAIAEESRALISDEEDFDVILLSNSGNSSEEWNGKFSIHISKQSFTNIDVSNTKIKSSTFQPNGNGKYIEVFETDKITSVLAPGNSSILQVSVNPEYAYYDYVEITYSGATVSNAVNISVVVPFNGKANQYVKKNIENNNIETIGNKLVYRPSGDDKKIIYYKLWINTTVNRDSTIMFTATFYKNGGKVLDYVNYFVTISYLTEPTITVDGTSTTYLAKGSSAQVKIDVLLDQKVDSLIMSGTNISGVSLSQLSKPVDDKERGVRTYTAVIYADVLASTGDKNTFYLEAVVSRELNGSRETKKSIATVVIVDFKVSQDGIQISNSVDNNLTIWQGVNRPFMVDYNILPESYPYPSTSEMAKAIQDLTAKRELFEKYEFYPVNDINNDGVISENESEIDANNTDYSYFVNYLYDDVKGKFVKQSLYERLYVVVNNVEIPISDTSIEKPFEFKEDGSLVTIRGTRISGPVNMLLKTYITSGYATQTLRTEFTITVKAYSDPDLPIKISNATEFNNLNPALYQTAEEKEKNDYILENDIFLEDFTSFNTDLISSFDGNGHTIYIKSFKQDSSVSKTLNLALFNNVNEYTTIKNVRVNLYNGGQLTINVTEFNTINVAGIAIENAGVITNSEVVSFYSEERAVGEILADSACVKHNKPQGININYVDANGTDSVYITDNAKWNSQVAGFVITNTGSITNSRVGGEEIIIVGAEKKIGGESSGFTYASYMTLDTFNIIGQGNVSGFVLSNSGYITSSFVKNIDIENQSNAISFFTSGFAGTNTNSILTSYIEGAKTPEPDENDLIAKETHSYFAFEGTSIRSKLGYITGFIYENEGSIKDSYSNILIANASDSTRVYYASGFVYENAGTVENCYSASQIANSKYSQMNFSGVNENGDLLKNGEYINCYFFNKEYEKSEDPNDYTTESQYSTGAQLIANPADLSSYYGFAIADGESDGIWRKTQVIDKEGKNVDIGITLIETNKTTISNRYTYYIEDDNFSGITAEDSLGRKYILPYSTLTFVGVSREIDTTLGGDYNPILIYDAQDFVEVSGTSSSMYVQEYFNDNAMWGSYRLVNNINLLDIANSEETVVLPSSSKAFAGKLYGNGFTISGISISAESSESVAFGLFKSIESRIKTTPIITNLDLVISQVIAGDVVMVGGLAGYIKDSTIINLDIKFEDQNSMVTGLNFVGGLAGLASGNNIIKNINITNPTAHAERRAGDDEENVYFSTSAQLQDFRIKIQNSLNYNTVASAPLIQNQMKKYAYAGALIGFVDNYVVDNKEFNINQATNYSINNIRVSGVVDIEGQVVGGIIGLTGYQSHVNDMGITISAESPSKILSTKYFAGGVIGQSFGSINRTFASYDQTTQDAIEDNLATFYKGNYDVERGQTDIFSSESYTQKYVGGLVGFVGSGKLSVSYSKLNVTAMSADYAGGLIGGMEVYNAISYKTTSSDEAKTTYTKYFINEAYASGDVRANVFAGGIIGVIKGSGSNVALLAVNSVNFFTNFNYQTNVHEEFGKIVDNMSITLKANSIVGHMVYFETKNNVTTEVVDENVNKDNYTNYITLMQAGEAYQSNNSTSIRNIPSVGYYEGYYTANGKLLTINMFGKVDGRIDSKNELYKNSLVFAISKPADYENSSVGHTYTQAGFINSGAWASENWTHPMQDLFPSIRYKRTYDVVFLDSYNIHEVFQQMVGKNTHVIVRGKRSALSEPTDCEHINLIKYYQDYGTEAVPIEGFSGILQGGGGKVGEDDVKIITDRPLFESTAPGFSINNLTIDFGEDANKEIEIKNGLISKSEMTESSISNLTININSEIIAKPEQANEINIGLIAPTIVSSSINGVKINSKLSSPILQVNPENISANFNVGILAGKATQTSAISTMNIEGIDFKIKSFVNISSAQNLNYGGYFGVFTKETSSQPVNIKLRDIAQDTQGTAVEGNLVLSANASGNVNLGGYIGNSIGINNYLFDETRDNKFNVDYKLGLTGSGQTVYSGGIIGCVDGTTLNGNDSSAGTSIDSTLFITQGSVGTLIAGGVIGGQPVIKQGEEGISVFPLTIKNFNDINFDVVSGDSVTYSPNKESLNGKYDDDENDEKVNAQYVSATNAYVGGITGKAVASFTYQSPITNINRDKQAIRISGSNIKLGSVLGEANHSVSIKAGITSQAEFMVSSTAEDENGVIVGGMVGDSLAENVEITETNATKPTYLGAVYSNAKNLIFGGALGNFASTHGETDLININNTIFGGVVKVYGANSNKINEKSGNITAGGTVGKIAATAKAYIQENYNFGDVFVEYGSGVDSLNSYNFGGIIGFTQQLTVSGTISETDETKLGITDNYSLVTSHNARYSTATNSTAHALFGNGNPFGGSSDQTTNYYNHAVCLLVDELGTDGSAYSVNDGETTNVNGYGAINYSDKVISSVIREVLHSDIKTNNGHKLSPISKNDLKDVETFNGMIYCLANFDTGIYEFTDKNDNIVKELTNIAIIGNRKIQQTFTYNGTSMVTHLKGYSSISGLALNITSNCEIETTGDYAPVVKEMSQNAIVYAINITGSLDIGGSNSLNLAGLVGKFNGGKIFDCSTDIDINYRAGVDGTVSGLVNSASDGYKLIENTFTGGSVSTMVKANVYAFTNGVGGESVNNCYTYTKLSPKDYLNAETLVGTIGVFGSATTSNCYYDVDGLNYSGLTDGSSRSTIISNFTSNMPWSKNDNFNYGYPTLNYAYLNNSSFVKYDSETKQCGHEECDSSCYDCYVITKNYSRYSNGTLPENILDEEGNAYDYYYYVPNGAVLFDDEISEENIVLRYDIDLTVKTSDCEEDSKTKQINSDKLDGNGKTIKGLTNSLYINFIGSATAKNDIRNLRLTDVNIEGAPALASYIGYANISNITLSGHITNANGSIADSLSNSTIDTTTNMIELIFAQETADDMIVGGLFGSVSNSSIIRYCSNYGPVRSYSSSQNNTNQNVGGLVGEMLGDSTINYSYNTASVLGNYAASTTALATTKGTFHTGGLVGHLTSGTITNSYNSGMIKSGNKQNDSQSYAGGIVGYSAGGSITACYNEGTVEALGTDPTWKIEQKTDKTGFSLKIFGSRNVWAYGIGYIGYTLADDGSNFNNNKVRIIDGEYSNGKVDKTIKQNGIYYDDASDEDGKIVKTWKIDDVYDYKNAGYNTGSKILYARFDHDKSKNNNNVYTENTISGLQTTYKMKSLNESNVKVTSLTENGLPNKIIVPITKQIRFLKDSIHYDDNYKVHREVDFEKDLSSAFLEFDDFASAQFNLDGYSSDLEASYLEAIYQTEDMVSNKTSGGRFNTNHVFTENDAFLEKVSVLDFKNNTRSKQTPQNTDNIEIVSVSGVDTYIANSNNYSQIFEAGIFAADVELEFAGIPYVNDYSCYTLTSNPSDISYKIKNISTTNNGVKIIASIAKEKTDEGTGFNSSYNFTLTFNYEKPKTLDLSNLSYSVVSDNKSVFGIDIDEIYDEVYEMQGFTLGEYDNIVKLSTEQWNSDGYNEPGNYTDSKYIYLVKDKEYQRFIYVPNATLWEGVNSKGIVNVIEGINTADLSYDNINTIINKLFNGKTLYYKSSESRTENINIFDKISKSGSITGEMTFGDSKGINKNYAFGTQGNLSENYSLIYDEENTAYKVQFNSDFITEDFIVLDNDSPIISYNSQSGALALGDKSTFTIGENEYTFTISENKIVIDNDLIAEESQEILNSLQSYFDSLTYVKNQNNVFKETINDQFSGLGTLSVIENNIGLTIERTINKEWTLPEDDDRYTIMGYGSAGLQIQINKDNLAGYTLNGVTIYKDSFSFSLTQSYTSTLGNVTIHTPSGARPYTEVQLQGSQTLTWNGIPASGNAEMNTIWNTTLDGTYTASVKAYSTYKEKSYTQDESSEYGIAFKSKDEDRYFFANISKQISSTQDNGTITYEWNFEFITEYFQDYAIKVKVEEDYAEIPEGKQPGDLVTDDVESYVVPPEEGDYKKYTFSDPYNKSEEGYENEILILWVYNNGNMYREVETDGQSQYLEFTEFGDIRNYSGHHLESLMDASNESLLTFEFDDSDSYLVLENENFEIIDKIEANYNNENIIQDTNVESDIHSWKKVEKNFPNLSNDTIQTNFDINLGFEGLNITFKNEQDEESILDYVINGNSLIVRLKGVDDSVNITAVLKNLTSDCNNVLEDLQGNNLIAIRVKDPCPIVLVKDVSMNEQVYSNKSSIIGNGYFIEFNDSFYNQLINSEYKFIKDVLFLGQTYNKSFLNSFENISQNYYFIDLNNVDFYGSIINFAGENVVINHSYARLTNTDSYVSVNGTQNGKALVLFGNSKIIATENQGIYNYGTIAGANGQKGRNGLNDRNPSYVVNTQRQGSGVAGGVGQSIKNSNVEESSEINNYGIIKAGDGGNGGAGGNHIVGKKIEKKDDEKTIVNLEDTVIGYAGGLAGEGGNKENNGLSAVISGIDGYAGCEGAARPAIFTNEAALSCSIIYKGTTTVEAVYEEGYDSLGDVNDDIKNNIKLLISGVEIKNLYLSSPTDIGETLNLNITKETDYLVESTFGIIKDSGLRKLLSLYTLAQESNTDQVIMPENVLTITADMIG